MDGEPIMGESAQQLLNLLEKRWAQALKENRLADAALVAIAAHLAFQEAKTPLLENVGLMWLAAIHKRLPINVKAEPSGPELETCSFCNQAKPADEVIVGVTSQICRSCVHNIANQLDRDT